MRSMIVASSAAMRSHAVGGDEYIVPPRYNLSMTSGPMTPAAPTPTPTQAAGMRGSARHATLYILAAALAAGLGLWAAQRHFAPPPTMPMPAMRSVTLFPTSRVLAPYRLTLSDGSALTPQAMQGHWSLVFLGFTRCPDVCPTTLQSLGQAGKAWTGFPAAIRPRVLFVSVDPDRDTPQHVGEYA